jgi:hydrogenase-4 component E
MLAPDMARAWIDALALLLLASAVGLVVTRRIESGIRVLALQGLLLAAVALVAALTTGSGHAYLAVALTVAVKVVAVPTLLLRALREVTLKREVELVIPRQLALLLALGLVLVSYHAAGSLLPLQGLITPNALPAALAMMLIGLFSMLIRKKALSQVVALVAMENGLYLAAVVATQGLPLAVELGVALDLLVGVVVMGLVAQQIHRTFDTINTDRLRSLRG